MGGSVGSIAAPAGGRTSSIQTSAENNSRISSARSGQRAAYSPTLGRSPRRNAAWNDSASFSTGSRPEPLWFIIEIPRFRLARKNGRSGCSRYFGSPCAAWRNASWSTSDGSILPLSRRSSRSATICRNRARCACTSAHAVWSPLAARWRRECSSGESIPCVVFVPIRSYIAPPGRPGTEKIMTAEQTARPERTSLLSLVTCPPTRRAW